MGGSFLEEHAEDLKRLGYDYILKGDRVVFKDLVDSVRMDIWISGPQDVAAYDIRSRLCGIRVNFFRDQLEGTVWYYRPGEKIYGNTKGDSCIAVGRDTMHACRIVCEKDWVLLPM